MSFATEQNKITRKPISLQVLKLDYCQNAFGVSPCTAEGVKCYNTYVTCKDKTHFVKTTKDYKYCSNESIQGITFFAIDALPYLLNKSYCATEIQEDKTIPARVSFTFMDEPDYDQLTDPYWEDRRANLLDGKGSHWKKLIERNPFYKGRILEDYEGFEGLTEAEFVKRFSGKIDNITRDGQTVKIDCVDDIVDLAEKKYPFKTNIKLAEDLGAVYEADTENAMLGLEPKVNDLVYRRDFLNTAVAPYNDVTSGTLTIGEVYKYIVVAYTIADKPIAYSEVTFLLESPYTSILVQWAEITGADYYRVYGRSETDINQYFETQGISFVDTGANVFTLTGTAVEIAERVFIYNGISPTDLVNWTEIFTQETIELDSVTGLDAAGYIRVEDEVIYYSSISSVTLQGVSRIQYKTKSAVHYEGTNIKLVTWKTPTNPFTILEDQLLDAGVLAARIDTTTIHALRDAYTGPYFSTLPITKESDAAKLLFDLAWLLDIYLWVNEEGKITCRYIEDVDTDYTITDDLNIVADSGSVNYNQDDIYTRCLLYWGRNDVTKSGTDKDNFKSINIEVYADSEGANMYDKELPLEVTTTWLNDDCDTPANIQTYLSTLLNNKLKRSTYPRSSFSFDVEMKDNDIKTGHVVELTSSAFNDINGDDYTGKKAIVIKKEPKGNLTNLTVRIIAVDAITTTTQNIVQILDTKVPINEFDKWEVSVSNLKFYKTSTSTWESGKVTGLANIENEIKLRWDNMYMSTETTVVDINGVSYTLKDVKEWKTVRYYNVYMFVATDGYNYPASDKVDVNETRGKWYLVGQIPDQKYNVIDSTFKYQVKINSNLLPLGSYCAFYVTAKADLHYKTFQHGIEVLQ